MFREGVCRSATRTHPQGCMMGGEHRQGRTRSSSADSSAGSARCTWSAITTMLRFSTRDFSHAWQPAERVRRRRCLPICHGALDHVLGTQSCDQRSRGIERNDSCHDRRWRRDRTRFRPRPCSAWSAGLFRLHAETTPSSVQSCRRDCGSSPVVGSSRNSKSGRLTSAHPMARRWRCPPDKLSHEAFPLGFEFDNREHIVNRTALRVERSEDPQRFLDGELLGKPRLLKLHAQPLS